MAALYSFYYGSTQRDGCVYVCVCGFFFLLSVLAKFFTLLSVYFSKLPSWARAVVPKIFYVTEKAWNYYPYTITGNAVILQAMQGARYTIITPIFETFSKKTKWKYWNVHLVLTNFRQSIIPCCSPQRWGCSPAGSYCMREEGSNHLCSI